MIVINNRKKLYTSFANMVSKTIRNKSCLQQTQRKLSKFYYSVPTKIGFVHMKMSIFADLSLIHNHLN